jgi:polygalacturonase
MRNDIQAESGFGITNADVFREEWMISMKRFQALRFAFPKSIRNFAAGALAVTLGLSIGVESARATAFNWTNAASSFWSNPSAWSPNGVPGPSDTATFSTRGTYTVTFTSSVIVSNLDVNVHSSSNLVLTLNLNGNSLSLIKPGSSSPAALFVGGSSSGNDTLYLSSSTSVGEGLFVTNAVSLRVTIGDDTTGLMIVTNGFVQVGAVGVVGNQLIIGNNSASSSQGTLVLSGPTVSWSNNACILIGNNSSASANSLVISNSASMTCAGASLTVGGAASGPNSLLLDSGGRLFVTAVGANVGTSTGSGNSVTVQNGAIWDLGNTPLSVGSAGANNSLTVGMNGTISNAMTVTIAPANSLILAGGLLQAAVAITNNGGTVAGFGTVIGETVFTGTGTLTPGSGNAVGTIVASNDVTLASGTTTIIKLDKSQIGSNDFLNVAGALTEAGALTINNVGPALTGGEIFQIFSSATPSGNFAATNLPSLNPGLNWNTGQLGSEGIISVASGLSVTGPTNQSVIVGTDVTISTVVTGNPAPSLQWELNGSNLSDGPTTNGGSSIVGSLTSTLTVSNVQPGDAGQYCLIASNTGATLTNCMILSVSGGPTPPTIIGPSNQNVVQGNTATFSASVSGVPAPAIQWQQNGLNITGATGTPLILTNVQLSQNGYVYSIIASNSLGEATNSATLQVTAPSVNVVPALPNIPTNQFNITNFGAYGDGASNNASAIQSAINAAGAAGGGTVIVSTVGVLTNYLSGPINLTNNVSLEIDSGAMLQALPKTSWPSVNTAFITATNVHDVEINGSGVIDGQGSGWWPGGGTRPPLVQMAACERILIQNVTAQNPPFYHFRLIGGNGDVTVQGITINTETNSPNTDGVDVSVTNCLIQNCWIQDGDDDICIKNDTGLPSANIVVSNCTFNGGHGVSVGSNVSGGLNNFVVSNCTYNGTIYGIRCKSDNSSFTAGGSGSGGLVQNLKYSNLTMTNVTYPIVIYSYYNEVGTPDEIAPEDAASEDVGSTNNCVIWRNITIANVTAAPVSIINHATSIIWGRLEMPASNITLSNVNIAAPSNTFCVYNAQGVQIIDSNLGDPNTKTDTFTMFNAQVTVTNSAPNANLVTLTGLDIPPTNNTLAFFGAQVGVTTNVLGPDPFLTLGSSTLSGGSNLNLGGASILDFALGTNTTEITVIKNLILGGTLNISDGGGLTNRTYTLFTYGGTLTYNGLTIGTTPNAGFAYAISTGTVGQVNLVVSNACPVGAAGSITGSSSVSAGTNGVAYSISSVSGATSYTWTVPSGASIASGQGTTSITVNYACSATSGGVTVTPSNGSCSGTSGSLSVTVTGVGAAGSISGPTGVCAGQTGVGYSISSVSGAATYTWTVPTGATITSGQGTTSITVTWGSTAGSVTVTPSASGCTGSGSSLSVSVNAAPGIVSGPSPQTVCNGGSASFTVSASGAGLSYQWQKNGSSINNGGTISGSTSTTLTLTGVSTGDSEASFDCVVSGTCSPPATSGGAVLTVNPSPSTFNVTGGGSYCVASGGVTVGLDGSESSADYQLELNGNPTGALVAGTGSALSFSNQTAVGTYTVVASNVTSRCTATMNGSASVTAGDPFTCWQLQYFGSSTNPAAAPNADPLGKGISNTNQFLLGLNPTNPASVFRIIAISQTGGTNTVTWKTSGGDVNVASFGGPTVITNIVQGSVGTARGGYSNNFGDIRGPLIIVPPGDTVTNYPDGSGTNRYYRIRLGP